MMYRKCGSGFSVEPEAYQCAWGYKFGFHPDVLEADQRALCLSASKFGSFDLDSDSPNSVDCHHD